MFSAVGRSGDTVAGSTQRQNVLGAGKLAEIAHLTGYQGSIQEVEDEDFIDESFDFHAGIDELDFDDLPSEEMEFGTADVVVFDCDLSPSQLRNVEAHLLCATYEFPWAYSLTFGYIGHLVGDACTKSGVNFFWPITTRYRVPLTPASNGFFEAITTLGCVVMASWIALR